METYYYVIYYANGTKRESGGFSGVAADTSAERQGAMEFQRELDNWRRSGMSDFFKPMRYEVRRR